MRTMKQQLATSFRCARRTLPWFIELIRASLEQLLTPCASYRGYEPLLQVHVSLQERLAAANVDCIGVTIAVEAARNRDRINHPHLPEPHQ